LSALNHTLYLLSKDNGDTNVSSLYVASSVYEDIFYLQDRVSIIRYGFIVVAATAVLPFLLFTIAFSFLGPSIRFNKEFVKHRVNTINGDNISRKQPKNVTIMLMLFMALLFFMFNFVNTNSGVFLATFIVKGLDWPNNYGALATSLYFGSNCLGKVLSIYPVLHLKPATLNFILMSSVLGGCLLMTFSYWHFSVLWVAVAIVGVSMSCINTACFFWVDAYLTINGKLSSVMMASGSIGAMTGPVLCGYLFDRFGPMTFVYTVLSGCILQLVLFIGAVGLSTKYCKNIKVSTETTIEKQTMLIQEKMECQEKCNNVPL
jgi:fucose permease